MYLSEIYFRINFSGEAGYVSNGLSVTGLMPRSSIIECTAGNTVNAYAAYTSAERPYTSSRNEVVSFNLFYYLYN